MRFTFIAASFCLLSVTPLTSTQTERKVTRLADGVYGIEHAAHGGGNTTVILGERQVFVVDTCFSPSAAREDIASIRQWTDKPVSFVLNTHFHNDHNLGNRVYMDAFPNLTIIAHAETRKDMDRFGPGSEIREVKTLESLRQMLASGKAPSGVALTGEDTKQVKEAIAGQEAIMEQLHNVKFQTATLTFEHGFSVDLGNREVRVQFLGRGNTAGDAAVGRVNSSAW